MAAATPDAASPRVIDAYGNGGFKIGGEAFSGSVLVLPDGSVTSWPVDLTALSAQDFTAVMASSPPPEILLLGCGARAMFVPPALRQSLRAAGIVIDAMDTGAACRTYNVLIAEQRRVAAALIAVG